MLPEALALVGKPQQSTDSGEPISILFYRFASKKSNLNIPTPPKILSTRFFELTLNSRNQIFGSGRLGLSRLRNLKVRTTCPALRDHLALATCGQ